MKIMAFFLGFLLVALGCGNGSSDSENSTGKFSADWELGRVQRSEREIFEVSYSVVPDPIPLNDYFEVVVSVLELEQSPEELRVEVDARMPAHNHGMNVLPSLTSPQRGKLIASGMLFHMPGHWEITARLTRGSLVDTAVFDVFLEL